MYEFLDRLITLALPSCSRLSRQLIQSHLMVVATTTVVCRSSSCFPEVDPETVNQPQGMNITMVTTAKTNDEGRRAAEGVGYAFQERKLQTR